MSTSTDDEAPSVSVIIPAYNSAAFLEDTIASVYRQTLAPKEVIVINDGSTDGTEDCLRRLARTLPASFIWRTKANGGEASARNLGIRLATGQYIAFLDHDDLWHPGKLEQQLACMEGDPDLALSFTGYSFTFRGYRETPGRNLTPEVIHHETWDPDPERVLTQLLDGRCPVGTLSTVLMRRDAVAQVTPFDEDLALGSDYQMYLRFAVKRLKMSYLPEALVEYRWHGSNLSRDTGVLWEHLCQIFDQFFVDYASELPDAVRRRANWWRAHWHLQTAIDAIQAGERGRARRHILTAARIHPRSARPGWVRMLGIGSVPRAAGGWPGVEPRSGGDTEVQPRPAAAHPLVTVVIPAYNAERTLAATLESVTRQTVADLEVIVVDDGSTDGTGDVARSLGDERVRVLRQANAGHAAARNTAIAEARGKYVALIDADDLWLAHKLERQLEILRANPHIRALHGAAVHVDDDLQPLFAGSCPEGKNDLLDVLCLRGLPGFMCTLIAERTLLDEVGRFDPSLIILQDWDLAIRLARRGELYSSSQALVLYRVHAGNQSKQIDLHIEPGKRILAGFFADPTLPPEILARRRYVYAHFFAMLSGGALQLQRPDYAIYWARRALRSDARVVTHLAALPMRRVQKRISRRRSAAVTRAHARASAPRPAR